MFSPSLVTMRFHSTLGLFHASPNRSIILPSYGYYSTIARFHPLSVNLVTCPAMKNFWFSYSEIMLLTQVCFRITTLRMYSQNDILCTDLSIVLFYCNQSMFFLLCGRPRFAYIYHIAGKTALLNRLARTVCSSFPWVRTRTHTHTHTHIYIYIYIYIYMDRFKI